MARYGVKAMCSPLYEVLQDGEPVFATTNLDTAKRSFHARVGADKEARFVLVENVTVKPGFNLSKLLRHNRDNSRSRYEVIMSYEPEQE